MFGSGGFPITSAVLQRMPLNFNDPNGYYRMLGVTPWADIGKIRRSFKQKAKLAHPDAGGDPEEFRLLLQAYETLSDPTTRQEYNRTPPGHVFLGEVEVEALRWADPTWVPPRKEEDSERDKGYSYLALSEDRDKVDRWYEVVGAVYRLYGAYGRVRISLEKVQGFNVRRIGAREYLVIPEHIEPNFFIAFHVLTNLFKKHTD
jgi:hypothetical protein